MARTNYYGSYTKRKGSNGAKVVVYRHPKYGSPRRVTTYPNGHGKVEYL